MSEITQKRLEFNRLSLKWHSDEAISVYRSFLGFSLSTFSELLSSCPFLSLDLRPASKFWRPHPTNNLTSTQLAGTTTIACNNNKALTDTPAPSLSSSVWSWEKSSNLFGYSLLFGKRWVIPKGFSPWTMYHDSDLLQKAFFVPSRRRGTSKPGLPFQQQGWNIKAPLGKTTHSIGVLLLEHSLDN